LARRTGGRAASNDDSMASRRLEVALANEVSARSATDPCGTARADPQDGQGERASRMEYGPLNRMTETTEVLKSGAAPAGRHFCGAHPFSKKPPNQRS